MKAEYVAIASIFFCFGMVLALALEVFGLKRLFLRHDAAMTGILEGHTAMMQVLGERCDAVASSLVSQNEKLNKLSDTAVHSETVLGATNRVAQTMRDEVRQLSKDSAAIVKAIDILDRRTQAIRRDYSFADEKMASIWNAVNGISSIPLTDAPRGVVNGYCGICGKGRRPDEKNIRNVSTEMSGPDDVVMMATTVCDNCAKSIDRIKAEGDDVER